jgi:co-chaperonin GroES (HSP10)
MYQAINNRIIVKKPLEKTTDSGIILTQQKEGRVFEMEVIATTELTKALQGKTIYCEPRNCVELSADGEGYYGALDIKDVVAIKE